MNGVMRMKKLLIVILVLLLILGGLFFWKGGHHALMLCEILEEWADADQATQSLSIQIQKPDFEADTAAEELKPLVRQMSISLESFWTEYADRDVLGFETGGATAYLCEGILYMDTGRCYALPNLEKLRKSVRDLATGLLLHGRATKEADTYHIDMKTDALELHVCVTADTQLRAISLNCITQDKTAITASLVPQKTVPRAIPQEVADAMVQAKMEPPISLSEPLEALKPLASNLEALQADAKFAVDCGILEVEGNGVVTMEDGKLVLTNDLGVVELTSLDKFKNLSPAAAAMMLLRSADYVPGDTGAEFRMEVPTYAVYSFAETLIPQFAQLPIELKDCQMVLRIPVEGPAVIHLQTDGTVPLVLVEIPLTFTADFTLN